MNLTDAVGLAGVLLILVAYGGVQLHRLDPHAAPALLMNLIGAGLVLYSLLYARNLSAVLMEAAWGLIALYGLVRLAVRR